MNNKLKIIYATIIGSTAILGGAIVLERQKTITPDEYFGIIKGYNDTIQGIRNDCSNDKRCDKGKVFIRGIKNIQGIKKELDNWVAIDKTTPNFYKIQAIK